MDIKEKFHSVALKRKTYFDEMLSDVELNLIEVEILVFLSQYPENNTFTKILKSKDYAKSYVSKAINSLFEKGYITKSACNGSKKVENLFLLAKSEVVVVKYNECVQKYRSQAFANIDSKEIEVFELVLNKMLDNLTKKEG